MKHRREVLVLLLAGTVYPALAFAGSYLDRAALLVHEAANASNYLHKRLYDGELARVVHQAAQMRVRSAREMLVPDEVIPAHPHLLLVLEQHERAANAAVQRAAKDFLRHLSQARDEEQLFRQVLKTLGWELPDVS